MAVDRVDGIGGWGLGWRVDPANVKFFADFYGRQRGQEVVAQPLADMHTQHL